MKSPSVTIPIAAIALLFCYQAYKTAQTPIRYVSNGTMLAKIEPPNHDDIIGSTYFATQAGIMQSQRVINAARHHIEASNPELIEQNPMIIFYMAHHREGTAFFDLVAESNNPQYAQLYLQHCMEEFLKLRSKLKMVEVEIIIFQDALTAHKYEDFFVDEIPRLIALSAIIIAIWIVFYLVCRKKKA